MRTIRAAVAGSAAVAVLVVAAPVTTAHAAEPPTITSIAPSSGPVGTKIAVNGTALGATSAVTIGSTAASYTVASDTRLDAVVPAGATSGTISVTTPDGTATSADPFTVLPPSATSLNLAVWPAAVIHGAPVTLRAVLRTSANGNAVGGRPIGFYSRTSSSSPWTYVGSATTAGTGIASLAHRPWGGVQYTARHPRSDGYAASASGNVGVRVATRVAARMSPATVEQYARSVVDGWVAPAHSGLPVYLQRYDGGGRWTTLQRTTLASDGRYRFTVSAPSLGEFGYRVVRPPDSDHLTGISNGIRLAVSRRTLRSGMSGPDVLWLQRQLQRLKHDVPKLDGSFGFDTLHAVYAFQKLHRLSRSGIVDDVVRARLAAATVPRMAHPRSGRAVEIDKTRQVLLLAQDGAVIRVLDVSTGNNQPYYSEGRRYIAFTPEGSFSVYRKIDGMRVSHLGELWRPSYFTGGFAIHGSPSVPVYPASHGCVRITMPAADRVFRLLPIGTHVRIYHS